MPRQSRKRKQLPRVQLRDEESPANESDDLVILAKRIKLRHESDQVTIQRARRALTQAMDEEFCITMTDRKTTGDPLGLHIAGEAQEANSLRDILSSLKETCDQTRRDAYIATIKNRAYNKQLRISRERFASTVKRDKLHNATEADLDLIRDGNDYFHGGNCVLDVEIWQPKGDRRDIETFQYLYGMSPNQVGRILSEETIDALDDHATIVASKFHKPNDYFHTSFAAFVEELIKHNFPDFLSNPNHSVTKRYWEFRDALNQVPRIKNP